MNKTIFKQAVAKIGTELAKEIVDQINNIPLINKSDDGLDKVLQIRGVSTEAMEPRENQTEGYHIVNLRAYTSDRFDSVMQRIVDEDEDFIENITDEDGELNAKYIVNRMCLTANYRESNQITAPLSSGSKVEVSIGFTEPDENGVVYCNVNNLRKIKPTVAKVKRISFEDLLGEMEEEVVVNNKLTLEKVVSQEDLKAYAKQESIALKEVMAEVKKTGQAANVKNIVAHLTAKQPELEVEEDLDLED